MEIENIELLTASQIAKPLKVSARTVTRWAAEGRHGMPLPIIDGGQGSVKLWHPGDIEKWWERRRRVNR